MRQIADPDLGLVPAPMDDPDAYPGGTYDGSYLLIGDRITGLRPVRRRRLERWHIEDVPPDGDLWHAGISYRPLSYGLLRANSVPVFRRIPVVAVGSNAAPAQLVRKFDGQPCSSVLPVVRGRLRGVGLAFSGHASRFGYLPAAPVATGDPATTTPVWVTLLDLDQLAVMDRTEGNYQPVVVGHPDQGWILELASGERLRRCVLYRSRHGVLDLPATQQPGVLVGQAEARAAVAKRVPTLSADLAAWRALGRRLAGTEGAGGGVGSGLSTLSDVAAAGLVRRDDGIAEFALAAPVDSCRYGDVESSLEDATDQALAAGARGVLASGRIDRRGEPCVALDRRSPENRGFASGYVFVRSRAVEDGDTPAVRQDERARIGLLCRVVHDPDLPSGHAGVDQIVRDALGVARRETVWVTPARHQPMQELLPSRFVVCRAQIADLHLVEQRACALTTATFDLLGIEPGDEVVLEGVVDPETGRAAMVRLKAIPTPESMVEERIRLSGGGLDSRYPSAREALGVHPDLPWVFIDQDVRAELYLSRLGPVRVRASRSFQARKETRELMLLLLLAGIGVLVLVESTALRWLFIGLIGAVALGGVLWRLADRLR